MLGWHRDPEREIPPAVVIHGEEDMLIPPANATPLAARWPEAKVELIPGAPHAVMAQEPQRVAAAILAALAAR